MNDGFVPMRTASELTGLHPNTLRKYADNYKIKSYRNPAGQRLLHKLSLQAFCSSHHVSPEIPKGGKESFLYARVSSKKQHDDLLRQIHFLQSRKPLYANYRVVQDIASGINFKRKGLQTILEACLRGTVGEVVVAHRDRLARFGYDLIAFLVERSGGIITVIDDQRNKSSEQELSEDLMSIVHVYCCRHMGKRSYQTRNESRQDTPQDQPGETRVISEVDVLE
jgi:predicted site-specific integrase-resolvase